MLSEGVPGDRRDASQPTLRDVQFKADVDDQITLDTAPEPEIQAERTRRNNDFAAEAAKQMPQQGPAQEPVADERLTSLEEQAKLAKAETEKWKALYGRSENKVGDIKR